MQYLILTVVLTIVVIWFCTKVENFDQPDALRHFLGTWIWLSDDGLRKEMLVINYGGDNRFLNLTKTVTIRKWFPPVHPNDPPLVAPPVKTVEQSPLYRVIRLSPTEILLRSVEPTYSELPFRVKLTDGGTHIEMHKKKYISSNKLNSSMIKF